jgi:hypothetical protein
MMNISEEIFACTDFCVCNYFPNKVRLRNFISQFGINILLHEISNADWPNIKTVDLSTLFNSKGSLS